MNIHNKRVIEYIEKEKVVSSSDIANLLKISWNTADRLLTELFIEGKVDRVKRKGVNLWLRK